MLVLLSPTKTMNDIINSSDKLTVPCFLSYTEQIYNKLKLFTEDDFKSCMKVNEKIAKQNVMRMNDFKFDKNGLMAIKAYNGITYKRLDVNSFSNEDLIFANENIRIISAMYGVLKPFDSIYPYRLEMQSKITVLNYSDIYEFWGEKIALKLQEDNDIILNLCSNEYTKSFLPYIKNTKNFYSCEFLVLKDNKYKNQATVSKQARGLMARYIIKNKITDIEKIKKFDEDNFLYSFEKSRNNKIVFVKKA